MLFSICVCRCGRWWARWAFCMLTCFTCVLCLLMCFLLLLLFVQCLLFYGVTFLLSFYLFTLLRVLRFLHFYIVTVLRSFTCLLVYFSMSLLFYVSLLFVLLFICSVCPRKARGPNAWERRSGTPSNLTTTNRAPPPVFRLIPTRVTNSLPVEPINPHYHINGHTLLLTSLYVTSFAQPLAITILFIFYWSSSLRQQSVHHSYVCVWHTGRTNNCIDGTLTWLRRGCHPAVHAPLNDK